MRVTIAVLLLSILVIGAENNYQNQLNQINKNFFIENKGQWPAEVKYLARLGGMNAWITTTGITYDYYQINRNYNPQDLAQLPAYEREKVERENTSIKGHVIKMSFVEGSKSQSKVSDKQDSYYNYLIGNDESKWASNVQLYGNVEEEEIYNQVNVKYYFDGNNLRYDYIVKPGADLEKLKVKFEGEEALSVNDKGELVIKTSLGDVTNGKLYSYQYENGSKREVACTFKLNSDNTVSFTAGNYDKTKELIIDPLIFSTFLGGSYSNSATDIEIDKFNNIFVIGNTNSPDFPIVNGAYKTFVNDDDIFISKLSSDGSNLIYSTVFGGSSMDYAKDILVDSIGDIYFVGQTQSYNFPKKNAFQSYKDSADGFITKLNSQGNSLIFSTFLGDNRYDVINSVAVDKDGGVYVTGFTYSSAFPVSSTAFQKTIGGNVDAFVTKLSKTGNTLEFSSFLGGSLADFGYSIVVDIEKNSYVTGQTASVNFPTTSNSFQPALKSTYDVFITKINQTGTVLRASTYLGGTNYDMGYSLTIDNDKNVYLTGETSSNNFPVSYNSIDTIYNGGQDVFFSKFNPDLTQLLYSTYLGGNSYDIGSSIKLDAINNIFIAGTTYSVNFPTSFYAYDNQINGDADAFITKINYLGTQISYSSFLGGNKADRLSKIAIDSTQNVVLAGNTSSVDFPTTINAPQLFQSGATNAFVSKMSIETAQITLLAPIGGEHWKANSTHNINWIEKNNIKNVLLEYTSNNGVTWNQIGIVESNKGTYNWLVPAILSSTVKVRARIEGYPEFNSVSLENFEITNSESSVIKLLTPNGGEFLVQGSNLSVTWQSNMVEKIDILISSDNGITWETIAEDINSSQAIYQANLQGVFSENYIVKLKSSNDSTVYDISDGKFIVAGIKVVSPNSNQSIFAGSKYVIQWIESGTDSIRIDYTINGGVTWKNIVSKYPSNSHKYIWTVPADTSISVVVRVMDIHNSSIEDKSDGNNEIWKEITVKRFTNEGYNLLSFGEALITIVVRSEVPNEINVTYYKKFSPRYFSLPTDIKSIANCYWALPSTYSYGKICIPIDKIPAGINLAKSVWLKETNDGEFSSVGGIVENGYFYSTSELNYTDLVSIGSTELILENNKEEEVISDYQLSQNYPNPFNPTTKIKYQIPKGGFVTLKVFDVLGREVAELVNQELSAGQYEVDFAPKANSGVYYYRLQAGDFVSTKKMILIK